MDDVHAPRPQRLAGGLHRPACACGWTDPETAHAAERTAFIESVKHTYRAYAEILDTLRWPAPETTPADPAETESAEIGPERIGPSVLDAP